MDYLKPRRYPYVMRSTSVPIEHGRRLHLQYCKFQHTGFHYRFVISSDGAIGDVVARIPSRKYVDLLWAQADLEGWANLNGEPVDPIR